MKIGSGETPVRQWSVMPIDALINKLLGVNLNAVARPLFIAVDGRSGGGKSTLAAQLARHIAHAALVHTDDVAWHHSYFDWSDLLIDGVLRPAHAQQPVHFRPPSWESRGRQGAIAIEEGCAVVIIEGVGASRKEIRPWLTSSIWIQSDMDEAERRGIARDGGTDAAKQFWMDWMKEESAFLVGQQPWLHATAIVNGTPQLPYDREREVVVAV